VNNTQRRIAGLRNAMEYGLGLAKRRQQARKDLDDIDEAIKTQNKEINRLAWAVVRGDK